jgi:hypothetical protein
VGACPDEGAVLAFLDGRVPPEDLDELDRHLDACSECRLVALVSTHGCGGSATIEEATETASPGRSAFPSTRTWAPRTIVGGRYQISRFIGRGGMGEVYAAVDLSLGTRIAIKSLPASLASDRRAIARLKREAVLARRVTHPSVCRTFDFGSDGDTLFLTMELLEGETLGGRLRRTGPLPLVTALVVIEQLAAALDAAHKVGVIHRDLKSDNVMLLAGPASDHPRVVVTDFGLAKLNATGEKPAGATEPQSGRLMGTLSYMAPEQMEGTTVTTGADIYALGVVIYEMVTGHLPFAGPTPLAAALRRLREPAPAPGSIVPGLPRSWDHAIRRCLERDPGDRFPSALALLAALKPSDNPAAPISLRRRAVPVLTVLAVLGPLIMLSPIIMNGGFGHGRLQPAMVNTPAAMVVEAAMHHSPPAPVTTWSSPPSLPADPSPPSSLYRKLRAVPLKSPRPMASDGMPSEGPERLEQDPADQASSAATGRSTAALEELLDPRRDYELIDPYGTRP